MCVGCNIVYYGICVVAYYSIYIYIYIYIYVYKYIYIHSKYCNKISHRREDYYVYAVWLGGIWGVVIQCMINMISNVGVIWYIR